MSARIPTFADAKAGEYYVCQDWDFMRSFQVRLEMDNGDKAGRMSCKVGGPLSQVQADFIARACNNHARLVKALEAADSYFHGGLDKREAKARVDAALKSAGVA